MENSLSMKRVRSFAAAAFAGSASALVILPVPALAQQANQQQPNDLHDINKQIAVGNYRNTIIPGTMPVIPNPYTFGHTAISYSGTGTDGKIQTLVCGWQAGKNGPESDGSLARTSNGVTISVYQDPQKSKIFVESKPNPDFKSSDPNRIGMIREAFTEKGEVLGVKAFAINKLTGKTTYDPGTPPAFADIAASIAEINKNWPLCATFLTLTAKTGMHNSDFNADEARARLMANQKSVAELSKK